MLWLSITFDRRTIQNTTNYSKIHLLLAILFLIIFWFNNSVIFIFLLTRNENCRWWCFSKCSRVENMWYWSEMFKEISEYFIRFSCDYRKLDNHLLENFFIEYMNLIDKFGRFSGTSSVKALDTNLLSISIQFQSLKGNNMFRNRLTNILPATQCLRIFGNIVTEKEQLVDTRKE